jgi:hypothetical protein
VRNGGRSSHGRPKDKAAEYQPFAREPVGNPSGERAAQSVHPHKAGAKDAELHVSEMHLRLYQWKEREDSLPISVIEQEDEPEESNSHPLGACVGRH